MPIPKHSSRALRRHHRNPELLARGAIIAASGIAPASCTDDQLQALACWFDDQLTLATGGLAIKQQVAAEIKKRNL